MMSTASASLGTPLPRLALTVVLTLGLLAGAWPALGKDVDPGTDDPAFATTDVSVPECTETATPIEPDPAVLAPRPTAWDHVVVSADGRSLEVYFWMGVEDCYGLHSVEVTPSDSGIGITLLTGTAADAEGRLCVALAQLYSTTLTLEAPLISNVG
jgi:hypothetical protein